MKIKTSVLRKIIREEMAAVDEAPRKKKRSKKRGRRLKKPAPPAELTKSQRQEKRERFDKSLKGRIRTAIDEAEGSDEYYEAMEAIKNEVVYQISQVLSAYDADFHGVEFDIESIVDDQMALSIWKDPDVLEEKLISLAQQAIDSATTTAPEAPDVAGMSPGPGLGEPGTYIEGKRSIKSLLLDTDE